MAALRLFQLSKSAQYNVLKNLSITDLIHLSCCSKKSKTFVKNVGIKASELSVRLGNDISFTISIVTRTRLMMVTFPARSTNTRRALDDLRQFYYEPLSFIQWIRHLSYIFNTNELKECSFSWTRNRYDMESVQRCLKGFTSRTVEVGRPLSHDNFQRILTFGLLPKTLVLYRNACQDSNFIRQVLAHKYDKVYINAYFPEHFSRLDNLLAINSAVIEIKGSTFSDKSLNQFLKIWMQTSMPRLRKLQFYFAHNRVIDRNVVLKGIKHTENPPEQRREIWVETEYGRYWDVVTGGLDITRIDEIKATINLERKIFKFCVSDE